MNASDTPPPLRVYTCYIDGVLHTQTFPHGQTQPPDLEREINRRFEEWLEMTAPGARANGRVSGIQFADMSD